MNPELFAHKLLEWAKSSDRVMPWKSEKDAYKIWLSEIILQQTRVEQGLPYYLHFIATYPDVHTLATASEAEVLKSWEGLGYYSRARNLHQTAKVISQQFNGVFPSSYTGLLQLKGIGPYTAAAIASFAFEEPKPVMDGNVLRFVSRILGMEIPVDTKEGKDTVYQYISDAIKYTLPSAYNQAMMDFGATVCKPVSPLCNNCPFSQYCIAFKQGKESIIPIKVKKTIKKELIFHYYVFNVEGQWTILQRRNKNDIWKGLYQFPAIEVEEKHHKQVAQKMHQLVNEIFPGIENFKPFFIKEIKQVLTHRIVIGQFYQIDINFPSPFKINKEYNLVERSKIRNFALPKIITEYLKLTNF